MEEWRDVPGFEGKYQISISTKEGKCRSMNYLGNSGVRELSNTPNKRDGRISWGLTKDGKTIVWQSARWIALTYPELVENEYFEGAEIDHIDTDPLNNHPSNLRWANRSGQMLNDLTRLHQRESQLNNPAHSKWVIKLSKNNETLHFYPSIKQAERETGINNTNIYRCCSGERKTAGGFVWKFSD